MAAPADSETSLFSNPEFWVAAATVTFVALLIRPLWKAVSKALDDRAAGIERDLAEARRLRAEAEAMLADAAQVQSQASAEAERLVAGARHQAERMRQQAEEATAAAIQRRQTQAEVRIAAAEAAAIADIRAAIVDTAVAASSRILAETVQGQQGHLLVDRAIDQAVARVA